MGRGLRIGHSATQNRTMPAAFGGYTVTGRDAAFVYGSSSASIPSNPVTTARNATGSGTRYDVTTDAELDAVPWGALGPGDVVNWFWKSTPYTKKPGLRAQGTALNPVIIQGVTDASGNRPRLNLDGAQTAQGSNVGANIVFAASDTEALGGIVIKRGPSDPYGAYKPSYIEFKNVELYGARTGASFISRAGATVAWPTFSAGIWIQLGAYITIENCVVYDCSMGFFSNAKDNIMGETTEHVTLRNNRFYGCGTVGDGGVHNVYLQCHRPIVEGNYIGQLRAGAGGSSYKSRCGHEVFRNNWVYSTSARALDLVHPEDQTDAMCAQAGFGVDYFYGNVIVHDYDSPMGGAYRPVHYGGDNSGEDEGAGGAVYPTGFPEYRYRLYWFNNTYITKHDGDPNRKLVMFQLSTQQQVVWAWNNIVSVTGSGPIERMCWMEYSGTINLLGKNVIYSPVDTLQNHRADGAADRGIVYQLGTAITGNPNFADLPNRDASILAGSSAINQATSTPAGLPSDSYTTELSSYPVLNQPRNATNGWSVRAAGTQDCGAFEYA